jgi:lysophospholipid acyltransferase (LPLAT)-like uncharacterized protein
MDKFELIGLIGSSYMKLVRLTALAIKKVNYQPVEKLIDEEKPFILSMWHSRFFMSPFALTLPYSKLSPMISNSKDGQFLVNLVKRFNITKCVRGSSSKGGAIALKSSLKMLKQGQILPITPDGPRGPARKVQQGVIAIAKLSKVPIVPFTYNASKKRTVNSWDKTLIPLPCSEFIFVYGNPIYIDRNADNEKEAKNLEHIMETIRKQADNWEF